MFYLDCGYGNILGKDSWCMPFSTWSNMYYTFEDALPNCSVMGGELCLWSELTNEHNLFTKVWSRGAAFAERMWHQASSLKPKTELVASLVRFEERLAMEGVPYAPTTSTFCTKNIAPCFGG